MTARALRCLFIGSAFSPHLSTSSVGLNLGGLRQVLQRSAMSSPMWVAIIAAIVGAVVVVGLETVRAVVARTMRRRKNRLRAGQPTSDQGR